MEGLKNMIVLKDLHSNIIEEAFVVVKPGLNVENIDLKSKENNNKLKCGNQYIIKEAEEVVINYINEIEKKKNSKDMKKIEIKYKKQKKLSFWLGTVAILGAIINFF